MDRGFKEVIKPVREVPTQLPTRADAGSAGYDFYSKQDALIPAGETFTFITDVKAFMQPDEVLYIHVRSSIGIKKGLVLANTTGVIDSSYYENPSNDGNIMIALKNTESHPVLIMAGERIAQGVFHKFLTAGDNPTGERTGGIGSSGRY